MRLWIEKPETQNRKLGPTGLTEPDKTRWWTGRGPSLASPDAVGQVFARFWNRTESFLRSEPRTAGGLPRPSANATGHPSQPRMNGPLSSMAWRFRSLSDSGACGYPRSLRSHCITFSQFKMTCLIMWMTWCELWLRRRLKERKTCSLPSS